MTDRLNNRVIRPDRLLTTLEQLLAIEATELEVALERAADIVAEVLSADKVDVFLFEPASKSLVARGTSATPMGRKQHEIGMDHLSLACGGRAAEVFKTGIPHTSGDARLDPRERVGIIVGLGVRSQVIVPLNVAGERRGVLMVVSAQPDWFSSEDLGFVEAVSRWTSLLIHRSELSQELLGQAEDRGRREAVGSLLSHLTPRQLEVAILIANGYSNQQIADKLVLTPGTVANHVAQTLDRLSVNTRVQVAALVAELGLHRSDGIASQSSD